MFPEAWTSIENDLISIIFNKMTNEEMFPRRLILIIIIFIKKFRAIVELLTVWINQISLFEHFINFISPRLNEFKYLLYLNSNY